MHPKWAQRVSTFGLVLSGMLIVWCLVDVLITCNDALGSSLGTRQTSALYGIGVAFLCARRFASVVEHQAQTPQQHIQSTTAMLCFVFSSVVARVLCIVFWQILVHHTPICRAKHSE